MQEETIENKLLSILERNAMALCIVRDLISYLEDIKKKIEASRSRENAIR